MRENGIPFVLSHEEAVEALNENVAKSHSARQVCHDRVRRVMTSSQPETCIDQVLDAIDDLAVAIANHFSTIGELKLLHPAAWDASEPGRLQREHDEAMQNLVAESLAIVFGARWPSDTR